MPSNWPSSTDRLAGSPQAAAVQRGARNRVLAAGCAGTNALCVMRPPWATTCSGRKDPMCWCE
jgi:hypothetical protein